MPTYKYKGFEISKQSGVWWAKNSDNHIIGNCQSLKVCKQHIKSYSYVYNMSCAELK